MRLNLIRIVLAAAVAAVCLGPTPARAAGDDGVALPVLGSAPTRAPAPKRVRVERHLAIVANVLHYLEDHLGVELVPESVDRADVRVAYLPGADALPAGTDLAPAVAGTFALSGAGSATTARLHTVLSATPDRFRLTLRLRW